MIKLQDFAKERRVTDRQVQRLLQKYAAELEGLFERKGPNGTWLSEEACEILRSKMKQAPTTVFEEDPRVEKLQAQIQELKRELYETQAEYTAYVKNATPLLQKASEQLTLAERAGEYKEQVDILKAQNVNLSTERDELKEKVKENEKEAEKANLELAEIEKNFGDLEKAIKEFFELPWWERMKKARKWRKALDKWGEDLSTLRSTWDKGE